MCHQLRGCHWCPLPQEWDRFLCQHGGLKATKSSKSSWESGVHGKTTTTCLCPIEQEERRRQTCSILGSERPTLHPDHSSEAQVGPAEGLWWLQHRQPGSCFVYICLTETSLTPGSQKWQKWLNSSRTSSSAAVGDQDVTKQLNPPVFVWLENQSESILLFRCEEKKCTPNFDVKNF